MKPTPTRCNLCEGYNPNCICHEVKKCCAECISPASGAPDETQTICLNPDCKYCHDTKKPKEGWEEIIKSWQFAENPTETKEPFFWRWTEHGIKMLSVYIHSVRAEAYEEGVLRGIELDKKAEIAEAVRERVAQLLAMLPPEKEHQEGELHKPGQIKGWNDYRRELLAILKPLK